jgi:hypothetical protein
MAPGTMIRSIRKFARATRSVSHLLLALENFQALGIEFVSLSEQLVPPDGLRLSRSPVVGYFELSRPFCFSGLPKVN